MQERTFKIEYQVSNTWKLFTQTHNESSASYIARDLAKSVQGLRVINPIGDTVYISPCDYVSFYIWLTLLTSLILVC